MLKIRISYVDDEEGNKEIEKIINQLKKIIRYYMRVKIMNLRIKNQYIKEDI